MLKILGGIGKGLSLFVPKKDLIRPTSVLLKRRLFDKFQNYDSITFIDGCAGAGAVGFEAWSRGCAELYLVESNRQVFGVLQRNLERIKGVYPQDYSKRPIVLKQGRIEKWLRFFKDEYCSWCEDRQIQTIFFFDPPYQDIQLYKKTIKLIVSDWFRGSIWIESDQQKGLPLTYWDDVFASFDVLQQGSRYIIIAHQ